MLLIFETKNDTQRRSVNAVLGAAMKARSNGEDAAVVLLQDGVLLALRPVSPALHEALKCGIVVYIDRFSVLQRRIATERLATEYRLSDADDLINLMVGDDVRIIWH